MAFAVGRGFLVMAPGRTVPVVPSSPAAAFLALHHRPGGFVVPNAWDAGSARILEQVGFEALATTSAGIAFANGRPDGTMGRREMLDAVAAIVASVGCPVTADLEAGYGDTAAQVAATIADAFALGAAGANVEDQDPRTRALFGPAQAAERIAAARDAGPTGSFVLNARIDSFLLASNGQPAGVVLEDVIDRAGRYAAAGADCIFVPGVDDLPTIAALVEAIDAPLNIVAGLTGGPVDIPQLRSAGVARISIGGSLARAALGLVERLGRDLLENGRYDVAEVAIAHRDLQQRFAPPS